jgi:hypothetical protein
LLPRGNVLIVGGFGVSEILGSAELYDPRAGTFAATGGMAMARRDHTATLAHGKVLVAGGVEIGPAVATAEQYDPVTGTFAATGSMTVARESHTATLLPNASVLVTGGLDADQVQVESAELYE